jgi:hypothetical protein
MDHQMDSLNRAKSGLKSIDFALEKLEKSLEKNIDLLDFTSNLYEFTSLVKYAPLVSVEVETSFSIYKTILTDKRTNLKEENCNLI